MRCRNLKCNKGLPNEAVWCPWCGRKQTDVPATRRKFKRRPNGSGSVYKMPDNQNRTKPWRASVYNKHRHTTECLGYFSSSTEAQLAISAYQDKLHIIHSGATVADIYKQLENNAFKLLTPSGLQGKKSAWKHLSTIGNMKMRNVKTAHFQSVIDHVIGNNLGTRPACEKIRQLGNQICREAMKNDLIDKNYCELVTMPKSGEVRRSIFSAEQIKQMWKHGDDFAIQVTLVMIYSGVRPTELCTMQKNNVHVETEFPYMVGGIKTDTGKNRIIPLHPKTLPIIKQWLEASTGEYLVPTGTGVALDINNFRKRNFYPALLQYGIIPPVKDEKGNPILDENGKPLKYTHTPDSCRHTFISQVIKRGGKEEFYTAIVGHTDADTSRENYFLLNHDDMQQLYDTTQLFDL